MCVCVCVCVCVRACVYLYLCTYTFVDVCFNFCVSMVCLKTPASLLCAHARTCHPFTPLAYHSPADHRGELSLLLIDHADGQARLTLESLGRTVSGSSLAYLDEGVVFLGSMFGDSQVRISFSIYPSIYLSIYPSIYLSIYLYIHTYISTYVRVWQCVVAACPPAHARPVAATDSGAPGQRHAL